MALNVKILAIIAGCLLGLACILFIVSNAVPIWSKVGAAGIESTIGLWKSCESIPNVKACANICDPKVNKDSNFCAKILAARAFVTLACILSGISTLCLFACAFIKDDKNRMISMVAKGLAFACLVMGIIGVVIGIYVTMGNGTRTELDMGAAAIIGIIAVIINFCGAIVAVLIR